MGVELLKSLVESGIVLHVCFVAYVGSLRAELGVFPEPAAWQRRKGLGTASPGHGVDRLLFEEAHMTLSGNGWYIVAPFDLDAIWQLRDRLDADVKRDVNRREQFLPC